jgi:Spy/CpxP family protein refolding chaperone
LTHPAAAAPDAARAGKKAGHGQGRKLMAAIEKLNLTDAQRARLRALQAQYQEQFQELRRGSSDREATREKAKTLRAKMRAEMLAVLTPAQRGQLKEELARMRAARRARASTEL